MDIQYYVELQRRMIDKNRKRRGVVQLRELQDLIGGRFLSVKMGSKPESIRRQPVFEPYAISPDKMSGYLIVPFGECDRTMAYRSGKHLLT